MKIGNKGLNFSSNSMSLLSIEDESSPVLSYSDSGLSQDGAFDEFFSSEFDNETPKQKKRSWASFFPPLLSIVGLGAGLFSCDTNPQQVAESDAVHIEVLKDKLAADYTAVADSFTANNINALVYVPDRTVLDAHEYLGLDNQLMMSSLSVPIRDTTSENYGDLALTYRSSILPHMVEERIHNELENRDVISVPNGRKISVYDLAELVSSINGGNISPSNVIERLVKLNPAVFLEQSELQPDTTNSTVKLWVDKEVISEEVNYYGGNRYRKLKGPFVLNMGNLLSRDTEETFMPPTLEMSGGGQTLVRVSPLSGQLLEETEEGLSIINSLPESLLRPMVIDDDLVDYYYQRFSDKPGNKLTKDVVRAALELGQKNMSGTGPRFPNVGWGIAMLDLESAGYFNPAYDSKTNRPNAVRTVGIGCFRPSTIVDIFKRSPELRNKYPNVFKHVSEGVMSEAGVTAFKSLTGVEQIDFMSAHMPKDFYPDFTTAYMSHMLPAVANETSALFQRYMNLRGDKEDNYEAYLLDMLSRTLYTREGDVDPLWSDYKSSAWWTSVYDQNDGFDINKDGTVKLAEVLAKFASRYPELNLTRPMRLYGGYEQLLSEMDSYWGVSSSKLSGGQPTPTNYITVPWLAPAAEEAFHRANTKYYQATGRNIPFVGAFRSFELQGDIAGSHPHSRTRSFHNYGAALDILPSAIDEVLPYLEDEGFKATVAHLSGEQGHVVHQPTQKILASIIRGG